MIEHLPDYEQTWLQRFFAAPNELSWSSLSDGSAPSQEAEQIQRWLSILTEPRHNVPLILPFVRGGMIDSWYATTQGPAGGYELKADINAWLGPTWLSRLEYIPAASNDPMAAVLQERFGSVVYRFSGPDARAMQAIKARLSEFLGVLKRRPIAMRTGTRPVGTIRRDFERALLAGDKSQAEVMVSELRRTGRLNEENMRFLEVRLKAGLGFWQQIARNHWLIKTLADLALPAQILSDLIEALYRTYIEDLEATGDRLAIRDAFASHIAIPYPKLFASRRNIRAHRVVKAFLLFEQRQMRPDTMIIDGLLALLPTSANTALFVEPRASTPPSPPVTAAREEEADEAFDDGQFDRALEFYLRLTPTRKTISRLISCVGVIGTDEARDRLLTLIDRTAPDLIEGLAPRLADKVANLRQGRSTDQLSPKNTPLKNAPNLWISWAERLQAGNDLEGAKRDIQLAPTSWDTAALREDGDAAKRFADILSSLNGEAYDIARTSIPQIFTSVFPPDAPPSPSTKPIASLLFLLIAMDETLSRVDLDLLAQLTGLLIEQGLSSDEYVLLINDLEDVQERISSYAYLPWGLDLSESLAALPCPSGAARDARLRLFMQILGDTSTFSHRLSLHDVIPIEALAKDYGIGPEDLPLRHRAGLNEFAAALPNLDGKMIGIYTLMESAGKRAKSALEQLFPGCKVALNSDLVCTTQLTSLAKAADLFVFAWKSSSHQAFYCVKEALGNGEPILVPGKGTASILRVVCDHFIQT